MKSLINYILALLSISAAGCTTAPAVLDNAVIVVLDRTDSLRAYPDAKEIMDGMELKKDLWQSAEVIITSVSDKDINRVHVLTLGGDNPWTGNEPIRKAHVTYFVHELQNALGNSSAGSLDHSIIGRTIIKAANRLANMQAHHKFLLVYSDLMENTDELNFYRPGMESMLTTHPDSIKHCLERTTPLGNLNGLNIWFVYISSGFKDNNRYMEIARFYQSWLENKGAQVHIGQSFNESL